MCKKMILPFLFSLILGCSTSLKVGSKHIEDLRSAFSYGLLTEDYGILSREDLEINACGATPVPFAEDSTSYAYWQCFEVQKSKLFCEGEGYDEEEKTRLTVMVLSGVLKGELHEYITSRAIPLADCKEFMKDWVRLVDKETYVCVSGAFTHRGTDVTGHWKWLWNFDRFKTKRGCESYFTGGCSLSYQRSHGCRPETLKH